MLENDKEALSFTSMLTISVPNHVSSLREAPLQEKRYQLRNSDHRKSSKYHHLACDEENANNEEIIKKNMVE